MWSSHAYVNQRLQIQLELLMVRGVPLKTCWAFNERWNNKFCYKVASCWLFLPNHTTMNGSINIKTFLYSTRNTKTHTSSLCILLQPPVNSSVFDPNMENFELNTRKKLYLINFLVNFFFYLLVSFSNIWSLPNYHIIYSLHLLFYIWKTNQYIDL